MEEEDILSTSTVLTIISVRAGILDRPPHPRLQLVSNDGVSHRVNDRDILIGNLSATLGNIQAYSIAMDLPPTQADAQQRG